MTADTGLIPCPVKLISVLVSLDSPSDLSSVLRNALLLRIRVLYIPCGKA